MYRNVVERIFGVAKSLFQILARGINYDERKAVKIIYACLALSNYRRSLSIDDRPFESPSVDTSRSRNDASSTDDGGSHSDDQSAVVWRDKLAKDMWRNYKAYKSDKSN